MSATPETITDLERRLRFQAAGPELRALILAGTGKPTIRVDLTDGQLIEGQSMGYSPAIEFWTASLGIVKVALLDLPEELRRCFERELESKYVKVIQDATITVNQCLADALAFQSATEDSYKGLAAQMADNSRRIQEIGEEMTALQVENTALQNENAGLRAELRALSG
jgi:hypothetical protein